MATYRKRSGKWQVQIRRKSGFQKSASFTSKKDAERWANAAEREAEQFDAGSNGFCRCSEPLTALIERYRTSILPLKRSAYQEGYILNALARQSFAALPAYKIRPDHIAEFRDQRLQEVSASTLNRTLVVLAHLFETARSEWGYQTLENPVSKVRKPQPNPSRTRRLADNEEVRLMSALSVSKNSTLKPLAIFALETAMRLGEMLSLEWDQIDPESKVLHLPLTKNGRARHVPLSGRAMALLAERRTHISRPFPSSHSAIKQAWRRSVNRAGIGDLHFHDLRHEAISRLFEKGLSLPEVALVSGHSDPRMLMKYTHVQAKNVAEKLT